MRFRSRGRTRLPAGMNKGEEAYAQHLANRMAAGLIVWYAFEPMNLRLADKTFYKVDFVVMLSDGQLECHEVKGRKGDGYWCEDDAKMKIKIAASLYPFQFKIVWPSRTGQWLYQDF